MSRVNLKNALSEKCEEKWTVNFKGDEPIIYDIPCILSDEIIESIVDEPSFEKAISESMQDEKMLLNLKQEINTHEKALKSVIKELDKLVKIALTGTLAKETIKARNRLILLKEKALERLKANRDKFRSVPDINEIREEAKTIRQ